MLVVSSMAVHWIYSLFVVYLARRYFLDCLVRSIITHFDSLCSSIQPSATAAAVYTPFIHTSHLSCPTSVHCGAVDKDRSIPHQRGTCTASVRPGWQRLQHPQEQSRAIVARPRLQSSVVDATGTSRQPA